LAVRLETIYIPVSWAWAQNSAVGLLLACLSGINGYRRRGPGERPAPASPDGAAFSPVKLPVGRKINHFHPLMDEFPVGDRVSGGRCHLETGS
jgi:hypothetical protein